MVAQVGLLLPAGSLHRLPLLGPALQSQAEPSHLLQFELEQSDLGLVSPLLLELVSPLLLDEEPPEEVSSPSLPELPPELVAPDEELLPPPESEELHASSTKPKTPIPTTVFQAFIKSSSASRSNSERMPRDAARRQLAERLGVSLRWHSHWNKPH